jgi:hypothetical protein
VSEEPRDGQSPAGFVSLEQLQELQLSGASEAEQTNLDSLPVQDNDNPIPGTDEELLLMKRALLQLQRKKLQNMASYGLAFYHPHAKQDAFHRAGGTRWRLWESGNRSGKSTGGVAEDCSWLLGFRPFYPSTDPAHIAGIPQDRPVKGLVITTDWDKVDEIFTSQRGAAVTTLVLLIWSNARTVAPSASTQLNPGV